MEAQEMLFTRNGSDEENGSEHDDVWDDTALIKAYDVAVKAVKDKIAQRLECNDLEGNDKSSVKRMLKKSGGSKNKRPEWQIGAPCRAIYSEDGRIYEASIQSIKSNTCIIKYVGYDNEEEVPISQLMVSEGLEARAKQEKASSYDANQEYFECSNLQRNAHQPKHQFSNENMSKRNLESKKPYAKESITNFGSQFPPLRQPPFCGLPTSNMASPHMIPSLPPPPPLCVTSSLPSGDSEALSAMLMSWYMSGFHTGYYQGLQQAKNMNGVAKQNP